MSGSLHRCPASYILPIVRTTASWTSSQRTSNAGIWCFLWCWLNKRLSKQSSVGDFRRHVGHCDVTVIRWGRLWNMNRPFSLWAGLLVYKTRHSMCICVETAFPSVSIGQSLIKRILKCLGNIWYNQNQFAESLWGTVECVFCIFITVASFYSNVYCGADQRKHQTPRQGPVTRKMFPLDDVIMDNFLKQRDPPPPPLKKKPRTRRASE